MGLFRSIRDAWRATAQPEMNPGNAPEDWAESGVWRGWVAPNNWVRGESQCQSALRAIAGGNKKRPQGYLVPVEVQLIREPENPYDPWAMRAEVLGRQCGYLAREIAEQVSPVLDSGRIDRMHCCGVIRGGYTRDGRGRPGDFGLHIWLERSSVAQPFEMALDDDGNDAVPWPPHPGEGDDDGIVWAGRGGRPG